MQNFDKTVHQLPSPAAGIANSMLVTIFDRNTAPKSYVLDSSNRSIVTFGRKDDHIRSDIELISMLVSRGHGRFTYRDDQWFIEDRGVFGSKPSENGLVLSFLASMATRSITDVYAETAVRSDTIVILLPTFLKYVSS